MALLRCARPRQEESPPAQAAAALAGAELPAAEQLLEAQAEALASPREAASVAQAQVVLAQAVQLALEVFVAAGQRESWQAWPLWAEQAQAEQAQPVQALEASAPAETRAFSL